MADSARSRALSCPHPEERQQCAEHDVIKLSLANLMTFPWIAAPAATGKLRLHGAWFSIRTGDLLILQPDGSFAAPR
jgi:carbonic anhydrase